MDLYLHRLIKGQENVTEEQIRSALENHRFFWTEVLFQYLTLFRYYQSVVTGENSENEDCFIQCISDIGKAKNSFTAFKWYYY